MVKSLIQQGRDVGILVRNNTRTADSFDVECVTGDILEPKALIRAFDGADTVYHLAGQFSLEQKTYPALHEANVNGTRNVVDACLKVGVARLVHCSSVQALSRKPDDEPVDENRPLLTEQKGAFAYGLSKADGEREVLKGVKNGLHACIVNPTGVIGPYDYKPSSMGQAILALCRGSMPALINGGFDWVDVRDVIQGMIAAGRKGRAGERYLLAGRWAHITEIAGFIEAFSGQKRPAFVCPVWLARVGVPFSTLTSKLQGKEPVFNHESLNILTTHRRITHDKAAAELGFAPRPLETSIEDTVRWFKEENYF
ncbi:MAG: NAD-dependent epimerase/dehydratase family protein [Proteobacteria bacterium]|nr:NAD-dependent epimerase/dehydratase family protein [Pseudomonadota bacterium]